jgi:multiple sugar transport system ATP-binding protein
MVFQSGALYPHMTVRDNIGFGLRLRRVAKLEIQSRVSEAATLLGLNECLLRYPGELSGGQRQRIALARAIVRRPKIFLFDEPLASLDPAMRAQFRREIAQLHARSDATIIYVTHDQAEALTLADRVAVVASGMLQQVDKPASIYRHPANTFVAQFIGSPPMNLLHVRAKPGVVFIGDQQFPISVAFAGDEIIVGVRPEDIVVDEVAACNFKAIVDFVEWTGPHSFVHARFGDNRIVAQAHSNLDFHAGDKVGLRLNMASACFFDPATGKALAP